LRVLLVEDEPTLAEALVEALEYDSHAVDHAADGEAASELADVNSYDVIILDWEIPRPSGIELLETWRSAGMQTPVLMLTGRSGVKDRVGGLDRGADDYLTKPFSVSELLARVRSLLRRRDKEIQISLAAGDLEMDRSAHRVTVDGREVALTPKEFALLEYFLHNVGRVVSRTAISEHVWDDGFDSFANVVDVTVHRLRRKVDGDREDTLIHTVKGVGYVLQPTRSVPD
jgi:DNA-binding response OmpR family regulator